LVSFLGTCIKKRSYKLNYSVSTSPNGWTDEHLCTEWFKHSFIPQANAKRLDDKPILLIFDGHGSHLTEEIHALALANNIHLLCLPAHTTHKLQPLDVGIFGPLATSFSRRCDEVLDQTGQEIPIDDFVKEYMVARAEAFKPETIKKAFANSGLNPLNPDIFTERDFAPSYQSSTQAQVPASFPEAVFGFAPFMPLQPLEDDEGGDGDKSDNHDESDGDDASDDEDDDKSGDEGDNQNDTFNMDVDMPHPHADSNSNEPTSPEGPSSSAATPPPPPHASSLPPPNLIVRHPRERPQLPALEIPPDLPPFQQMALAMARIKELESKYQALEDELDATKTHCAIASIEIGELKTRLNAKMTRKTKRPTVGLSARWITSGKGWEEFDAIIAEKKAKARKKDEEKERREKEAEARRAARQVRGPTLEFAGSLKGKNKDDLLEIAGALALDVAGKKTNKDLIDAIKSYLDTHQHLQNNSRFAGLFPGGHSRRGQRRNNDENMPSSSDQRHMTSLPVTAQTRSGPGPSNRLFGAPILNDPSYSNSTVSYSYPQNQLPYLQFTNPNSLPPPIVYNYPYNQPHSPPP